MAHRWARRWKARPEGGPQNLAEVLHVAPLEGTMDGVWALPPSKSHAIRWLMMGALSEGELRLNGAAGLGEDARSMRRCLTQLGVEVVDCDGAWEMRPAAPFVRPPSLLHAGNSGTALRMLVALASHLDVPVMLDGDASLRRRGADDLARVLRDQGVKVRCGDGHERLPMEVRGPWTGSTGREAVLRRDRSSQPYSALLMSSPLVHGEHEVRLDGVVRSSQHAALSERVASMCGWPGNLSKDTLSLSPWTPKPPTEVTLPGDASMASFAMLYVRTVGARLSLVGWPDAEEALGAHILHDLAPALGVAWDKGVLAPDDTTREVDVDLSSANDLICPLAALLALGGGGVIRGAPHARHKESDRISSTVDLLNTFGIEATATDDGMHVNGGQRLRQPNSVVRTFGDHRVMMTAVALAASTGATVEGPRLHNVADPTYLDRVAGLGLRCTSATE